MGGRQYSDDLSTEKSLSIFIKTALLSQVPDGGKELRKKWLKAIGDHLFPEDDIPLEISTRELRPFQSALTQSNLKDVRQENVIGLARELEIQKMQSPEIAQFFYLVFNSFSKGPLELRLVFEGRSKIFSALELTDEQIDAIEERVENLDFSYRDKTRKFLGRNRGMSGNTNGGQSI